MLVKRAKINGDMLRQCMRKRNWSRSDTSWCTSRIIVMDISKEKKKEPRYFVNPVIKIKIQKKQPMRDVFLCQISLQIDRPSKCEVEYLIMMEKKLLKADGFLLLYST